METNTIGFEAGKTFKLTADIQPGNATDKTVVWSSSDETVATVSDDGTVTIKKEGNVTIKAESGGKSASDTFVFYEGEDRGYYVDENETKETYYIWNEDGLLAWNKYVTNTEHYVESTDTYGDKCYVVKTNATLMDNISLEGKSWTPVGYYDYDTYYYAGTFDGGGHTISNLSIDPSYNNDSGLFGYIATDGVVKNLTLSGVEISGYEYIGGIAGNNYGTIANCNVYGSVSGIFDVGGIVGYNGGTISGCNNEGNVSETEKGCVGGIAGFSYGTISACYNIGEISGTDSVGGIAGYSEGTIENCNVSGSVSGNEDVGGIAGYSEGTIENCNVSGSVSGSSYVGGIAGVNLETIENCSVSGSVSGIFDIGGIVGYNGGTISACYNTSNVSETDYNTGNDSETEKRGVGGIVGYNEKTITACYNIGEVSGTEDVGGIAGENGYGLTEGIIISCYNTGKVSESSNIGGIGGIAGYNNVIDTIRACYWSVSEESSTNYDGIGNGPTSETVKKVGPNGVTWDVALSVMNEALGTESEYSYKKNDNSATNGTMPLVIVKLSN